MVRGIDTHAEGPVMTLHFTLQPDADRDKDRDTISLSLVHEE